MKAGLCTSEELFRFDSIIFGLAKAIFNKSMSIDKFDYGYKSNLLTPAKNCGFAVLIFPLQILTKKISGHNILWSAIFSRFKISRYIPKWNDVFKRSAYYTKFDLRFLQIACQNLQSSQIADFKWISQIKSPKSIQEMGFYNSTMALSSGFTFGVNVNDIFLSTRTEI